MNIHEAPVEGIKHCIVIDSWFMLRQMQALDIFYLFGDIIIIIIIDRLSGQWSGFLGIDPEVRVRFPAPPDFLKSSGSGTGSTQPREYN
jgi:hypothetical protein